MAAIKWSQNPVSAKVFTSTEKDIGTVDIEDEKSLHCIVDFSWRRSPSAAGRDRRGDCQGHFMKQEAFMSTLLKSLLSWADR